ncbi:MAG: hypothetical protein ACOY0T_18825 [Myxococcota bacterium]
MADEINTSLFFPGNASTPASVGRVLDILEGEPILKPTHASNDARKRAPYDRAAATASVTGKTVAGLVLWRTSAPKYSEGYVSANAKNFNWALFDFASPREQHAREILEVWTRAAQQLAPEFGFVHYAWKLGTPESTEYNRGAKTPIKKIRDHGFRSFGARNWFGPDLVSLIGKDRLLKLPLTVPTSWGGVQLDLLDEPWNASFEALYQRQQEVIRIFASWGLMGDYKNISQTLPGPNWTPRLWDC